MRKSREVTTFEQAREKASHVITERHPSSASHANPYHEEEGRRMRTYEARLRSFAAWPKTAPLLAEDLARAGWYYLNWDDRVRCAWCHGSVFNWEAKDSAFGEHHRHFPHCDFVQSRYNTAFDRTPVICQLPGEVRASTLAEVDWEKLPCVAAVREMKEFSNEEVTDMIYRFRRSGIASTYAKSLIATLMFNVLNYSIFRIGLNFRETVERVVGLGRSCSCLR